MQVGAGDEVITVANTAIPTVSAIRMVGARPVFADIDPNTLLIDLADAERRITPRTKAIIPVHLFGNAVNMDQAMDLGVRHGLAVIEDCAEACGTRWRGQMTGTLGDIGCFSFYPTKNLGAYGDGGLCFTRHKLLAEAMRQIRSYGCAKTYDCQREGVCSRLDELHAAVLDVKLAHLDEYLAARCAVARAYQRHLDSSVARPCVLPAAMHSYHLFVIASTFRDELTASLAAEEIGFGIHYPTPIHRMRGYEFLGYAAGSLPVTEQMATRILSLPCYPELPLDDVERVCAVVNEVVDRQA